MQEVELDAVQLRDGVAALAAHAALTHPLSVRVPPGGLLWVGGASVVSSKYGKGSRHGLAAVLGGWGSVAAGRVLLGHDDLALLPLSEVRRQVVVVPRDTMLVSGSVRENLDLVSKAQGDWQLWAALEQCLFADTVRSWPGKLDCVIQAAGCGSEVCAGLWGGEARKCLCQDAACHDAPRAAGVYCLSLHERQLLGLARAVLTAALNGSRVLVVEVSSSSSFSSPSLLLLILLLMSVWTNVLVAEM